MSEERRRGSDKGTGGGEESQREVRRGQSEGGEERTGEPGEEKRGVNR